MDEDAMWKGMWEKLQEVKTEKPTETEAIIQDLDGGFFERFGSLLQQAEIKHEETILAELPQVSQCRALDQAVPENAAACEDSTEVATDSGIENVETDSESEEGVHSVDFIEDVVGWNLEELYKEVLYETLHNVGYEDDELGDNVLFSYLQDSFKFSPDKHDNLLDEAKRKEAPEIRLNVEVVEAKDLRSMDPNGSADPFVTMYLESNPTQRFNTSVKAGTLTPRWEEHFSLPIADDSNSENLIIEVWDFDPAETIKEKVNKVFDVKGVRGIRKLLKEIAVTSYAGNHKNELIGKTYIPLKTIPASGIVMWYSLDKKGKTKRTGLLRMRINFSSEKNLQVAMQEHRHLSKVLLLHELEKSQVAHYWWAGKFSPQGDAILTQHAAQSGMTPIDTAFAKWSVYCDVHGNHPLSFSLFDNLLDKLIRAIQSRTVSKDECKLFWESTRKLLPSCMNVIRRIRKSSAVDRNSVKTISEALSILAKVTQLEVPEDFDLFIPQLYGWLPADTDEPWEIRQVVIEAIKTGATNWYEHVVEQHPYGDDVGGEQLQHLIKIIQLIRSDLQRSLEYYDKIFYEALRVLYTREAYAIYEALLANAVQPEVVRTCKSLKRIHLEDDRSPQHIDEQDINMGTSLFELYLVLKRFVLFGQSLNQTSVDYKIQNYYQWFVAGVSHWLDIALYKAMIRIKKAIELDSLAPIEDGIKRSTSAIDTMAIFNQIRIFWNQLEWPDVEGSYMFIGKIVDDICQCCVFYANKMSERVERLGNVTTVYEKKFEVTQEWCLAINNIEYIRENLLSFVHELGVDDVVQRLADIKSQSEAERCEATLRNVTDNAIDTAKNKILELIETVAKKMSPQMRKFLQEGAEVLHEDSNSMDRLMMYMEESLATLYAELNDMNFQRILDAIWIELSIILLELVQTNLDKRRPPSFFHNLHKTLKLMVKSFKIPGRSEDDGETTEIETLRAVENLLSLHGCETADLIHRYYKERLQEQKQQQDTPLGSLTVQAYFRGNVLELEIMNARNLRPMDSNGTCDSYVRVHFVPEDKFANISKPKTNTQSKTVFPLYEEKFSISLTPEQRAINDAVLVFCVKDSDYYGAVHRYNCEAYHSFEDIADITGESGHIQQTHLTLSRPSKTVIYDSEILRAIELRQGDKQAKEFMKKLKQKIGG